ncbi:uncharacterized protein LOC114946377 [Nylanderia fulva]|uniref:uncharacterized protein LOC114946377 n=1 Tax=Nylanderia fulva TaxID=613905 RepID=UPI0010FAE197|nr:uncharacterized protein LOC114946377 [Nylanderia fulva]
MHIKKKNEIQTAVQDNKRDDVISPSLLFPRLIKESKKGLKSHEKKHAVNKNVKTNSIDLDNNIENKPPTASLARLQKKKKNINEQININMRSKAQRSALNGWDCWECEKYYKSLSLSKTELQKRKNKCSRHRKKYERPHTPKGAMGGESTHVIPKTMSAEKFFDKGLNPKFPNYIESRFRIVMRGFLATGEVRKETAQGLRANSADSVAHSDSSYQDSEAEGTLLETRIVSQSDVMTYYALV